MIFFHCFQFASERAIALVGVRGHQGVGWGPRERERECRRESAETKEEQIESAESRAESNSLQSRHISLCTDSAKRVPNSAPAEARTGMKRRLNAIRT